MAAYYNEFDPFAAQWLRELIKKGLIADGEVDERSIIDVRPDDISGFEQCHFFAGIGVWSHALRKAGWPDAHPVWTGSCPCQPFSAAGKGAGFTDERHLWPHFHWLIENCRPSIVLGEQVASKDGLGWLDLIQADLEGSGYASGAVDTCAAGFGAPHIRQRLYWVAHTQPDVLDDAFGTRLEGQRCGYSATFGHGQGSVRPVAEASEFGRVADSAGVGRVGWRSGSEGDEPGEIERSERLCDAGRLANDNDDGCVAPAITGFHNSEYNAKPRSSIVGWPSPTNGQWRDADWLFCRDGKWRPVEPGTFPLAHGAAARVGRLRGYGNAIVAPQAQAFIEAVMQVL